jgi:hypothetical protein
MPIGFIGDQLTYHLPIHGLGQLASHPLNELSDSPGPGGIICLGGIVGAHEESAHFFLGGPGRGLHAGGNIAHRIVGDS